jgi:hypothetical protein
MGECDGVGSLYREVKASAACIPQGQQRKQLVTLADIFHSAMAYGSESRLGHTETPNTWEATDAFWAARRLLGTHRRTIPLTPGQLL